MTRTLTSDAVYQTDADPATTDLGVVVRPVGGSTTITSVIPGTGATNLGKAEDAAHTSGDVGVFALAVRTDTPIQRAQTDGDYSPIITGAFGQAWAGLVDPDGSMVSFAGITTIYQLLTTLATTNAANLKNAAGRYFWIRGRNNAAASRFIKIYNKASAPTVGTDIPVDTVEVTAQSYFTFDFPAGMYLATGISLAITTAAAVADTGACAAGDITCLSVGYA